MKSQKPKASPKVLELGKETLKTLAIRSGVRAGGGFTPSVCEWTCWYCGTKAK